MLMPLGDRQAMHLLMIKVTLLENISMMEAKLLTKLV